MDDELVARIEARLASPRLTPMLRQYLGVKAEHPEAVVLFRMGDFFEAFFEDAEECARRLDITLTHRSKEKDVPMAGVPHHALDGHLARLIEQGKTVVLVDQVEDPKLAKGLVRREVTRVVTPGTFLDPAAPSRLPRYLGSLELSPRSKTDRWALAALDVGTGELRATFGQSAELLVDEVGRLSAKEVLWSDRAESDPLLETLEAEFPGVVFTRLDGRVHDPEASLATVERVLGAEERAAAEALLPKAALVAAGRALAYAADTQARDAPDRRGQPGLGHVGRIRPYVPGDALVLDREARAHLELFRTTTGEHRGCLLWAVDRTVTPMGARRLASWLSHPPRDRKVAHARHDAVEALVSAPGSLDRIRDGLGRVGDVERLLGRLMLGRALPRDLLQLAASLAEVPGLVAAVADAVGDELGAGSGRLAELAELDPCAELRDRLLDALDPDASNDLTTGRVFRPGFDAELDHCALLADDGASAVAALEARERKATGIGSLKVRSNRVFGYFIEVTKANLSLVPDRYLRKQTMVGAERFVTDELATLEEDLRSAEARRLERTEALFLAVLEAATKESSRMRRLAEGLSDLDALAGFARLAAEQDFCRPELSSGAEIAIEGGRHPVLEQMSGALEERFVPNDVHLSSDERLMIVTGPNMAGKSTIMRQTALIALLAYAGSFVPARSARIGRVDRIHTRVGASDDLSRGRSTFMVEMAETARILRSATEHDLVILDEIGRGTSTFDGLSIAWAVAEHLHDVVRARVMFATHYHEMTELARERPGAFNRHVAVREHRDRIVFLRTLEPGGTQRSYGVQVARLAGLPPPVVARAKSLLDRLERQGRGLASPVGQLPLFEVAPEPDPVLTAVADRLSAVDVDELTPRQALDLVAELKSLLP